MPLIPKISIPPYETLEELRRSVEYAVNNLIDRINNIKATQLDAAGTRLINVAKPASRTDAVNLEYLNEALEGLSAGNARGLDITTTTATTSVTLSDEMIITKV